MNNMSRTPQEGPEIIKQRQSFVQEIQLAPILDMSKFVAVAPAAPAAATTVIDNGAILGFDANNITDPQLKEDVDYSTMFAGLAASHQYDRFTDASNWYKSYVKVLSQLGWAITNFNITPYQASGSTFEIDKAVLQLLQTIASGGEVTLAQSAMAALRSLPGKERGFYLWDSTTHTAQNANFQIGVATLSGGYVVMSIIGLYFSASQINSDFLWFSWPSSNITLFTALQVMELDEDVYSQVRNLVLTKLGANSVNLLANLI
jgi:hypothetical protein